MIIDGMLLLDSSSSLTGGTTASANVIDLLNARDIGLGDGPDLDLWVQVMTTFLSTNAATLGVAFQGSTDNSNWDTYAQTATLALADLTAGKNIFNVKVPAKRDGQSMPRYLRLNYTIANHLTVGTVSAGILLDRQANKDYPSGFTVAN